VQKKNGGTGLCKKKNEGRIGLCRKWETGYVQIKNGGGGGGGGGVAHGSLKLT
jgi:hypothetical protein